MPKFLQIMLLRIQIALHSVQLPLLIAALCHCSYSNSVTRSKLLYPLPIGGAPFNGTLPDVSFVSVQCSEAGGMQRLYLYLKGTDSKLLLLQISICCYCLSGGCLKCVQFHNWFWLY